MQHIPDYLPKAILDVAAIAGDGRLSELQFAYHDVCRAAGGLPHEGERRKTVNHLEAGAVVTAEVARVVSHLFGIPRESVEQVAINLLVHRSVDYLALDLIADFRRDIDPVKEEATAKTNGKPAKSSEKLSKGKSAKPARRDW